MLAEASGQLPASALYLKIISPAVTADSHDEVLIYKNVIMQKVY